MAEHLCCVLSPGWDHCKMGMWRGHYQDLWSRYATLLGPDITTVVVFGCQGSIVLEKMLLTYARKLHITGEVFHKEAFQLFLEFCNVMCDDKVRLPTSRNTEMREQARLEMITNHTTLRHRSMGLLDLALRARFLPLAIKGYPLRQTCCPTSKHH